MRKLILVVFVFSMFFSCSQYQLLLKSTDYELKYEKAMEFYEAGDYMRASTLLNELMGIYRGTDKAETINFRYAKSLYGLQQYTLAQHYFNQFAKTYPSSELVEECHYMSAYCYYMLSPNPRLDQTDTENAINEFQLFINLYPNSDKVAEASKIITELTDKLVYKSYLSAKLYYNLGTYMGNNYQSAVIAAQNCLKKYPDTKYREDLSFLVLESKYVMAENSVYSKIDKRMRDAIDEYFSFINEFPESKYMEDAVKIFDKASKVVNYEKTN